MVPFCPVQMVTRESDSVWKTEGVSVSFLDLRGQRGKSQTKEGMDDKASWCLQQIKAKMNKSKK